MDYLAKLSKARQEGAVLWLAPATAYCAWRACLTSVCRHDKAELRSRAHAGSSSGATLQ